MVSTGALSYQVPKPIITNCVLTSLKKWHFKVSCHSFRIHRLNVGLFQRWGTFLKCTECDHSVFFCPVGNCLIGDTQVENDVFVTSQSHCNFNSSSMGFWKRWAARSSFRNPTGEYTPKLLELRDIVSKKVWKRELKIFSAVYEGTIYALGTKHSPEMLVGLQNGVDVPLSTVKAVSHVPAPTSTPILLNLRCSFMKVGTTTGNRCLWKWTEINYKRPLVVWARNLQVVFMSENTSCATPASSLYLDCGFANDLQVSSNSEWTPVLLDYCGSLAFKHVLFLRLSVSWCLVSIRDISDKKDDLP